MQELLWSIQYFGKSWARQLLATPQLLSAWWRFWSSYFRFKRLAKAENVPLAKNLFPCLNEDTQETYIEPTYFYQDNWAFEKIVNQKPQQHIDIGSHHKFVAFLSKVVPVTMVDIRPLSLPLESLQFKQGSILDLPFENGTITSLSSLCVIEHIGLGRYGDDLDPQGSEKALTELKRVIAKDGHLYLSVPIDNQNKIFFNAHRAFCEEYLESLFKPFEILERRYIFGNQYLPYKLEGFGIGLYHLKKSSI
jgi:SAM-dependent methyltransferase